MEHIEITFKPKTSEGARVGISSRGVGEGLSSDDWNWDWEINEWQKYKSEMYRNAKILEDFGW